MMVQPPKPKTAPTNEDQAVTIELKATDLDSSDLTFAIATIPTSGSLGTIGTPACSDSGGITTCTASVTYTPNPNFNGSDSFTYTASDGSTTSAPVSVSITINPVNDSPVAVNDPYNTNEDTVLNVGAPGVLGNDNDPEGNPLTAALFSGPAHGALTLNGDGSFTYTPNLNFAGTDSFSYKVNDGSVDSTSATVTITVGAQNDPPVAGNQSVSTAENVAVNITLMGSDVDNDPLTYSVVTPPAHGVLSGTAPSLTYTPAANYNGPDSFTFKVNDGTVDSNVASVSITVTPVNNPPAANPQSVTTPEDTAVAITLTGSDVDNDPLTYSVVTPPAHGVLSGTAPSLTYTPAANYNGPDSFTFKVNDGKVDSNTATVSITVTVVNDAPVATPDTKEHDPKHSNNLRSHRSNSQRFTRSIQ